ncbi:MAG TPA: bifunctional oligoribonuclease/PAP phosphatase NrnA [Geobacteraceae bacterium]|nr:bifunctional oligoribonuclease/PAP phosphatase NrnA [Geobacteraceae bacterium]
MIQRIISEIELNNTFLVTAHENPDGDAIGSSLAMANYLASLGKDVTIYSCDPVPDNYMFLPLAGNVLYEIPNRHFDICFILDAGDMGRAGKNLSKCGRIGKIINIDHHPDNKNFGDINVVDPGASATGALIYRVLSAAGHVIDYNTALCIYTAIVTDTGSFRYSNADQEAFHISGQMIAKGINPWFVTENLYESQPRQRLDLLSLALSTLQVADRGDIASITVTLDMFSKTGATPDLTDGFINYPRSIKGVEVAIFFREIEKNTFKVGFRSKGKVDVSSLAAVFGGGGHHNAAGCKISGPIEEAKNNIISYLEKSF